MTWDKIKDVAWFIFIWILAIELIENVGTSYFVEMAGDVFGALALMYLGVERALRDE